MHAASTSSALGKEFGCAKFFPLLKTTGTSTYFQENGRALGPDTCTDDEADAQTDNQDKYSIDGAARGAPVECDRGQVTESVEVSPPVAQDDDGLADNPASHLQGQLETDLV